MISGEYSHTIDAKNRTILPSKLREEVGSEVIMTKSLDKCISVYTKESWNKFTEKLDSLPGIETRKIKRFLYSAAFETSVDAQGRVLISPNLCKYAELKKNLIIVGVGDHIEIWDEDNWNAETDSSVTSEFADTLIKLGF